MELSISNIAWDGKLDEDVYKLMRQYGFSGLEIAPTRIFTTEPYSRLPEATKWANELKTTYGFCVPSMQSIWYGRGEKLFGSKEERQTLLDYTKEAVDFAQAIGCKNLVFGCPRNRQIPEDFDERIAIDFFREVGDYAADHDTVIGMEANPPIYNTNFINDTPSALDLIKKVDSKGFRLNLDIGTMIENGEDVDSLIGSVNLFNHVHISEPGLAPIQRRGLHSELKEILLKEHYDGYVSIEMGKVEDISRIEEALDYIRELFK